MNKIKTLVIAPHADDEVFGCAGTIMKRLSEHNPVYCVLVTSPSKNLNFNEKQLIKRSSQIEKVREKIGIPKNNFIELNLPSTELESIPLSELVGKFSDLFKKIKPNEIFLPHYGDAHSDHRIIFNAAISAAKWFRCNSINDILTYEVVSETEFAPVSSQQFLPNVYIDISKFFNKKLKLVEIYKTEIKNHPFPRSAAHIKALAIHRGATSGYNYAEAFQLIKSRK